MEEPLFFRDIKLFPIQVHDELVLEAKNSELADVEKILREAMEKVVELSVPLVIDIHSGINWSLAK